VHNKLTFHSSVDIAHANSTNSPLLHLPAELRNKIWRYVLGGKEYRVEVSKNTPVCRLKSEGKRDVELLSVCKQIHAEAALLPIQLSVFEVLPHLALRWLETEKFTTAQEDSISMLRVQFADAMHGATWLKYFWGLRCVYVCYTPDRQLERPEVLASVTERLRMDAKKPGLSVVFLRLYDLGP
jgi:hypothetical protein